ncbi:uncharacterized protein LOC123957573 [Micropterus dolomieu]|uniref:uncharacterized protein LOC123957573 n=1 Tax=Micropterus dolomieu TaxID=147949 RepID=UPI001E8E015D|nr:uncharacterized protein LOC123957573 [Micropterus dolomieu]
MTARSTKSIPKNSDGLINRTNFGFPHCHPKQQNTQVQCNTRSDDVASLSPVQHVTPGATQLQGPVYYISGDDVQFLGLVLHSTPDTAEHGGTVNHSMPDDDTEYFNVMQELPVTMTNFNRDLAEPEDSDVVHIGPQSEDGVDDLPTTLPWTEDHSDETGAQPSEVPEMTLPLVSEPSTAEAISLPPSSLERPQHPKETRYAHVRRVMIVEDLMNVFMDTKVMNMDLKMEFKNEMAVDSSGVSREEVSS